MYHLYNFPLLPRDLSLYIYNFTRNNAANTIIDYWYRYISKKTIAAQLVLEITNRLNTYTVDYVYNYNPNNSTYNLNTPYNLHQQTYANRIYTVLNYCDNVLTGNEDSHWWLRRMNIIAQAIYYNFNAFNHSNMDIQNLLRNINMQYRNIINKFQNYNYPNNNNIGAFNNDINIINNI